MQKPLDRKVPIDNPRYARWLASFSGYVSEVTRRKIELWLDQFDAPERAIAARVLDAVMFIGHQQIKTQFRELLNGLSGWHEDPNKRKGRWFFVPFSSSTGESGDSMAHVFRMATGMTQTKYNKLFPHRSELVKLRPADGDTVVLIDDFSGTGRQASTTWNNSFAELLPEWPRVIFLVVAATHNAVATVKNETEMQLVCASLLDHRQNFFDGACKFFEPSEKAKIEDYCKKADAKFPRGSGAAGLLVVLAHRCPNNSLPILHADHQSWSGLFPRNFD
jgi:hypothetical protein